METNNDTFIKKVNFILGWHEFINKENQTIIRSNEITGFKICGIPCDM